MSNYNGSVFRGQDGSYVSYCGSDFKLDKTTGRRDTPKAKRVLDFLNKQHEKITHEAEALASQIPLQKPAFKEPMALFNAIIKYHKELHLYKHQIDEVLESQENLQTKKEQLFRLVQLNLQQYDDGWWYAEHIENLLMEELRANYPNASDTCRGIGWHQHAWGHFNSLISVDKCMFDKEKEFFEKGEIRQQFIKKYCAEKMAELRSNFNAKMNLEETAQQAKDFENFVNPNKNLLNIKQNYKKNLEGLFHSRAVSRKTKRKTRKNNKSV